MQNRTFHSSFVYRQRNKSYFSPIPKPPKKKARMNFKVEISQKSTRHTSSTKQARCVVDETEASLLHVQLNLHAQCLAQVDTDTHVQLYVEDNRES